jgi:tellurite resistance protein TerC
LTDDVPTWVWVATVAGLLGIVVIDLVVIGRRRRAVTMRDATTWVLIYVGLAMAFAVGLAVFAGPTAAGEFVAGYVTEYIRSVDNLFVFMIIMARFAVPMLAQDKVLYIGIVLSMVLRTVCIVAGGAACSRFGWVLLVLGALLVWAAG